MPYHGGALILRAIPDKLSRQNVPGLHTNAQHTFITTS